MATSTHHNQGSLKLWLHNLAAEILDFDVEDLDATKSFLALGGDSLSAIEYMAKCRDHQVRIEISDMMGEGSLSQLIDRIILSQTTEQDSAALPIESGHLRHETNEVESSHRSDSPLQMIIVTLNYPITASSAKLALETIIHQHQALVSKLNEEASVVEQNPILDVNGDSTPSFYFDEVVTGLEQVGAPAVERLCKSLDNEQGNVFGAVISSPPGEVQELIFAARSAVIDQTSWRIIVRDFRAALPSEPQSSDLISTVSAFVPIQGLGQDGHDEELVAPNGKRSQFGGWEPADATIILEEATTAKILRGDGHKVLRTAAADIINAALLLTASDLGLSTGLTHVHHVFNGRAGPPKLPGVVGCFNKSVAMELDQLPNNYSDVIEVLRKVKDAASRSMARRRNPRSSIGGGRQASHTDENSVPIPPSYSLHMDINSADTLEVPQTDMVDLEGISWIRGANGQFETTSPKADNSIRINVKVWHGKLRFSVHSTTLFQEGSSGRDFVNAVQHNIIQLLAELEKAPLRATFSDFPLLDASYNALDTLFESLQSVNPNPLEAVQDIGPCSPMQNNFLASQKLNPKAYQCRFVVRITSSTSDGGLDLSSVKAYWAQVIARHTILRTTFLESDTHLGKFDQVVWKHVEPWVTIYDNYAAILDDKEFPTFPTHQPPHRFSIATASDGSIYVRLDISHALVDGQSTEVLMRDFCHAYSGTLSKSEALPYLDFTAAELSINTAPTSTYWSQYMENAQESHLPVHSSIGTSALQSTQAQVDLPAGLLGSFCGRFGVTPANVCQVAWGLVLRSFTNSDDVCFSYVTSRRQTPLLGVQEAVGLFIDVLFCRMNLENNALMKQVLALVSQGFVQSLPYQNMTAALANDPQGISVRQWGNTVLSFHRVLPTQEHAKAGLSFELVGRTTPTDYDVSLNIDIGDDAIHVNMDFWESKMDGPLAENILGVFQEAIKFLLQHAQEPAQTFLPLTESDKEKLQQSSELEFSQADSCVHELVQAIAARQPHSPAVSAWDGDWTYEELVTSATFLSQELTADGGVNLGSTVGICMEKSRWAVVAMLAILISGAAVVPVGIDDPRAEELLRGANVSLVLVSPSLSKKVSAMNFRAFVVGGNARDSAIIPAPNNGIGSQSVPHDSPAWILFTSGSSGKPKGVVLDHAALSTSLLAQGKSFDIGLGVRTLQFAAYTFADSVADIFSTLVMGGCVCVPSEEDRTTNLAAAMHKLEVNQATLTSTVAGLLLEPAETPVLRRLILSGEKPSSAVVRKWMPHTQVINGYGQSEASIFASCSQPIIDPADSSNIGLPITGRFWIVQPDNYHQLCPVGGTGELLIESRALAHGYMGDAERTASVFVDTPRFLQELGLSSNGRSGRMYRTGDLVRESLSDGSYIFVGRQDTQIKIRGQRVELGEIESAIASLLPSDTFIAVTVSLIDFNSQGSSQPKLVAALELAASQIKTKDSEDTRALSLTELPSGLGAKLEMLQNSLLERLPVHMVPTFFVPMTHLPVNKSKKIDRRALRWVLEAMDPEQVRNLTLLDAAHQQPTTEAEHQLQSLWALAFGRPVESISIKEHFFQAGGDSVTAVRMAAAARNNGRTLTVADIFKYPRIEALAKVLDNGTDTKSAHANVLEEEDPRPFALWKESDDMFSIATQCGVDVSQIEDVYPCTPLQEGLMAITAQRSRADVYVAQRCYRFSSDVNLEEFRGVWERLVACTPILRTRIALTQEGTAVQVVLRETVQWNHVGGEGDNALFTYLKKQDQMPIEYGQPLSQVTLVGGNKSGNYHRYFFWKIHHSLYDGWTTVKVLDLLAKLWAGQQPSVPPVPMSRFIRYLNHQEDEAVRKFWIHHLEGVTKSRFPPQLDTFYEPLPTHKVERKMTISGSRDKVNTTTSTLLRAAWAVLLASFSGEQEAVMTVTLSGRNAPVSGIIDLMAPTLTSVPFRVSVPLWKSVHEFLKDVQNRTTNMIPFEHTGLQHIRKIVPGLAADFDPGHVFTIQTSPPPEENDQTPTLANKLERLGSDMDAVQSYAFALDCIMTHDKTFVTLEARFDVKVISREQVEIILDQFDHAFCQLSEFSEQGQSKIIGDLDVMSSLDMAGLRDTQAQYQSQRDVSYVEDQLVHKLIDSRHDNTLEKQELQLIWSKSLKLPLHDIPFNRSFLSLGGDSIAAIRAVALCRAQGISISLRNVIQCQSITDLALLISSSVKQINTDTQLADSSALTLTQKDLEALATLGAGINQEDVEEVLPCSPIQQGILLSQLRSPDSYRMFQTFRLCLNNDSTQQAVDVPRLMQAWRQLQARHSIMRTIFVESLPDHEGFHQVVLKSPEAKILLKVCPKESDPVQYLTEMATFTETPGLPPHRLIILQGADGSVYGRVETTHALVDAASFEILTRELLDSYESVTFTTPGSNYGKYVSYLQQQSAEKDLQFWTTLLADASPCLLQPPALLEDNNEPRINNDDAVYNTTPFASAMLKDISALDSFQKSEKVTLANVFELAWAVLLASYTGSDRVCWGGLFNGRDIALPNAESIVGPMINQTIHFIPLDRDSTVGDAARDVQQRLLDAFEHQSSSLAAIQHSLKNVDRALFNTLLSYRRRGNYSNRSVVLEPIQTIDPTEYDITLHVLPNESLSEIEVVMQHSPEFMDSVAAERMLHHFLEIVQSLVKNPSQRIGNLVGLSKSDLSQILSWNHDYNTPKVDSCAHQLVEQRLQSQPNKLVVDAWDGTLTARELIETSSYLADHLVQLTQVLPDSLVGFCMTKSKWSVVGMLGILKSGGAVVPLGVQDPLSRIEMIVRSSGTKIIVADKEQVSRLASLESHGVRFVVVQDVCRAREVQDGLPSFQQTTKMAVKSSNIAFVMHTSGSTGTPKGVIVDHGSLCSSMKAWLENPHVGFGPNARILQFTAFTFDPANHEILSGLYGGGCVCVPSEHDRMNNMEKFINDFQVTAATLTPSVARLMAPENVPSLKTLALMGEAVKPSDVERWLERGSTQVVNAYGPTECTIIVSVSQPLKKQREAPIIGYPLRSVSLWVVQPHDFNYLCPVGVPGELLIEGPLVASGYLNEEQQTAASFVVDPAFVHRIGLETGRRMYRTGDIVRQNQDGSITYIERRDNQVKIHGQRVEISEIENSLLRLDPGFIQMAYVGLVSASDDSSRESRLIAAVQIGNNKFNENEDFVISPDSPALLIQLDTIRRSLQAALPSYMVPSVIVPFVKIPLTSAGKIDRSTVHNILNNLGEVNLNSYTTPVPATTSEAALSPAEQILQTLWASVLQRPIHAISAQDDFFQIGGDSISAMKLVAAARRAEPVIFLTVAALFQHPRLADLARFTEAEDMFNVAPKSVVDAAPFTLSLEVPSSRPSQIASIAEQCGVVADNIEDVYPCAPLQEGLMAITTKRPDKYVLQRVFRLNGDINSFRTAWETLWQTVTVLRTRIVAWETGSVQVIVREPVHWRSSSSLQNYIEEDRRNPMTYGSSLCRIAIVESEEKHVVLTMHHSIYDGWSMFKTMDMLARLARNESVSQPVPMSRFIRYLALQDESTTRSFWRKHLGTANVIKFPELPVDPSYLPQSTQHARRHISRCVGHPSGSVTTSNILRATWAILLAAYAGTDSGEALIMVALSGRQAPVEGILNILGPTVATVPVRVQIPQSDSIPAFLSRVQQDAVEMIQHEHTGLQNIRRYVPELDDGLFTPAHLFTVQAAIEGDDDGKPSSSSEKLLIPIANENKDTDSNQGYAFNMECTMTVDEQIDVDIWFDQVTVSHSQVHRILEQFENIFQQLSQFSDDESRLVSDLNLISPQDHAQISSWNEKIPERTDQCIHEILQDIADRQPDAPAICSWDGDLTYRELVNTGSRLAHYLRSLDSRVGPEALLGMCMSKSKWALVSIVAILQAGAGVVPLGIGHPVARIQAIVDNTQTALIITDSEQAARLSPLGAKTVVVDEDLINSLPPQDELVPACDTVTADNTSYVVFTSGSTGTPKGSILEHGALASSLLKHSRMLRLEARSRALQFAAFTFDNSISDIFATLFQGGCVCEPSEDDRVSNLAKAVWDLRVNVLSLTPTVAALLRPQDVPPIDTLIVGGEPLDPNVIDIWGKSSAIINSYGPSECSILVACSRPLVERRDAPNVGLPVACCFWVVSPTDYNRLSPIGAPGELLLQGPQLGRGYINEPEKTANAFVVNPHWVENFPLARNQRLYRSGDLVRQNPDQSLTMLGRRDTQVKIHGQRVEIGEVESWIVRLVPDVLKAAVDYIAITSGRDDRVLVAALEFEATTAAKAVPVAIAETSLVLRRTLEQLRTDLRAVLPSYMIPMVFLPVTRLPLNPSSKLDRLALRTVFGTLTADDWNRHLFSHASPKSVVTETESLLRGFWAKVLSLDETLIGRDDNLFDLGGDSVVAMRLTALTRDAGLHLTVADIFRNPVLEKLAAAVDNSSASTTSGLQRYEPLSLVDETTKTTVLETVRQSSWIQTSGATILDIAPVTDFQAISVAGMLSESRMDVNYIAIDGKGQFSFDELKQACLSLVEQTEILRTAFVRDGDQQFWQVILNTYVPEIQGYDSENNSIGAFTETFIKEERFGSPEQGKPPMDIAVITKNGSNEHRILFRMSHALYDAHSLPLIWDGLIAAHRGAAIKSQPAFTSYLSDLHSRVENTSSTYWREFLHGSEMPQLGRLHTTQTELKALELPKQTITLPPSGASGMMPAVIVKAAWGMVLAKHSGLSDVIFAEASTGRNAVDPAVAGAYGCCVTALPFRFLVPQDEDITTLLDRIREQQTKSIQHESLGTKRIIESCTNWNRFTSLINHQRAQGSSFTLGDTEYTPAFVPPIDGFYMMTDITITATQGPGTLEVGLAYAVDLMSSDFAGSLLHDLRVAIEAIISKPTAPVSFISESLGPNSLLENESGK